MALEVPRILASASCIVLYIEISYLNNDLAFSAPLFFPKRKIPYPTPISKSIKMVNFWLLSQAPESSEQFAWLSRNHREMETQLAHSGTAPSIPADLSQNEAI